MRVEHAKRLVACLAVVVSTLALIVLSPAGRPAGPRSTNTSAGGASGTLARPAPAPGEESTESVGTGTHQTRAEVTVAPSLSVVDARDRSPVCGALVVLGERCQRTDRSGRALVATDPVARVGEQLHVSAPGYLALEAPFQPELATATFALERAGRLELRFTRADGTSEAGVEVQLLPPVDRRPDWGDHDWLQGVDALLHQQARRPAAGLVLRDDGAHIRAGFPVPVPVRARSGADGVARFESLVPATYRWTLRSGSPAGGGVPRVELRPPHERQPLSENADGKAVVHDNAPLRISGAFDVEAGRTTRIDVPVLGSFSLAGRFLCGATFIPPQVKLYRLHALTPTRGPSVQKFQCERLVPADAEGRFRFDDVAPGTYLVRSWWQTDATISFGAATCVVADADVDLGDLRPAQGARVTLRAGLVEARSPGSTPHERVDPREVYPDATPPVATVQIHVAADSRLTTEFFHEVVTVPLEATIELTGLADGELSLQARPAPWTAPAGRPDPVEPSQEIRERTADGAHYELALRARRETTVQIEFVDGTPPATIDLWLRDRDTGLSAALTWNVRAGSAALDGSVSIQPGRYELLARERGERARVRLLPIEVGEAAMAVAVELGEGAAIELLGTAAETGQDAPARRLAWSLAGWSVSMFALALDGEHRAVLDGLPPHAKLVGRLPSSPDLTAGAVGETRMVGLELD